MVVLAEIAEVGVWGCVICPACCALVALVAELDCVTYHVEADLPRMLVLTTVARLDAMMI